MVCQIILFVWPFKLDALVISRLADQKKDLEILIQHSPTRASFPKIAGK